MSEVEEYPAQPMQQQVKDSKEKDDHIPLGLHATEISQKCSQKKVVCKI